jgi:Asp-tRNA(Asn)/Glu-tRNA(Gln) amidotransferase A subunit family amidase
MPDKPYVSFVDANGLQGARVGVLKESYALTPATPDGLELARKSIKVFEDHGAHVIHDLSIATDLSKYNAANWGGPHFLDQNRPQLRWNLLL